MEKINTLLMKRINIPLMKKTIYPLTKKTIYPVILLALLLLVSCKSKKNMVASLPHPVLHTDSIYPDTTNAIAGLFAPDHSKLKALAVSKNKRNSDYVIKKAIIKQNQFTKEAGQWNLKL